MFALLGVLLALGVAGWLRKGRPPPASASANQNEDRATKTHLLDNTAQPSAHDRPISARTARVALLRNSSLDAAEPTAAVSSEPARAEAFDSAAAIVRIESREHGGERNAAIIANGPALAAALPQKTLELALELPDSPEKHDLLQRAAAAWLQSDPSAALEWAKEVEDAAIRRVVIRQYVDNLLASNDPAGAAPWLDRIPNPIDRNAMISRVSESWGRLESHTAWQWAAALPEGEARAIAIQNILSSWAEQHPVEAATAAVNQLPPLEQSHGVLAVLLFWTQRDPAAAASWVSLFPESPLRETATQNVVGNWALRDIDSARQWLERLPFGPSRDAALLTWGSLHSFTDH